MSPRTAAALATVVAAGACAAPATAVPWDRGGAIAPSQTPAPSRPDPECRESYANDRSAPGPRLRFGIAADELGGAVALRADTFAAPAFGAHDFFLQ